MSLIFLYLMKPFMRINLYIKVLPIVCSNVWMMHHNIRGFINFTCKMSLMARKFQQLDIWIWSFQNVTCVSIHASYKILTSYMLPKRKGYKCIFLIFEIEKKSILMGSIDASWSTLLTLSIMQSSSSLIIETTQIHLITKTKKMPTWWKKHDCNILINTIFVDNTLRPMTNNNTHDLFI